MSFDSSRSANSGSKSKRSLNSASNSNTSSKKKTSQKTLGMAWGSNSRSNSRSSFRSSPFSDFGSYMEVKNRKLHDQFDAEASSSSGAGSRKPIFNGVSIFVDGYTVPSSQELRGYMVKHGGRFENYFSRHRVTHIICSNLPDSKIKNLRSFSGGLPVVKPTWVLDSVAANKLLSWIPYQLDQLASETNNQPKLSAFFTVRSHEVDGNPATCLTNQMVSGAEDPSVEDGTFVDGNFSELSESVEDMKEQDGEVDVQENFCGAVLNDPNFNKNTFDAKIVESNDVAVGDRGLVEMQPESSPCRPSVSVSSYCIDDQNTKESPSTIVDSSNQKHSTLMDPNFVENYFKNSRLHFIGTWRNRYRKRFPSSSDGSRPSTSSPIASSMCQKTAIIHVDMDCFFVSVLTRKHPDLLDKPVAVCHSDNPRGTAEISSANYPARGHGVRAGIFVRDAKALCPHLVILPYDFEAYEEVADQFYSILHKHCNIVQAMSCDEAFLDVSDSEMKDPTLLASVIRKEIFNTTGCTASAGISGNMLMARLATRAAKPDGQCYIPPDKVDDYLKELPIKALPGIGRALEEKLKRKEVKTCGQLRVISKESLRKDFGLKTGDMLWNYCRGTDNRLVGMIQESKSVGAEVNWGVRFNSLKDSQHFLVNLCKEVSLRLQGCGVQGRTFTLKVKKRKVGADEPTKYMGCGDCDNLSHSMTIPMATEDANVLQRIATQLFGFFHIDVKDIRGMGLQVSKLESSDSDNQGQERNSIRSWLASPSARTREHREVKSSAGKRSISDIDGNLKNLGGDSTTPVGCNIGQLGNDLAVGASTSNGEVSISEASALPPLHDLDMEVIMSLPPELFSEVNAMYGGKLTMLKHEGKALNSSSICTSHGTVEEGGKNEAREPFPNQTASRGIIIAEEKEELHLPVSRERTSDVVTCASVPANIGLMPSSLSQVDVSVLQELPEELRVDILEILPAHRRPICALDGSLHPQDSFRTNCSNIQPGSEDYVSSNELWIGNPPRWVEKFGASGCQILNFFAQKYRELGHAGNVSSILLRTVAETRFTVAGITDELTDAISYFVEVFKQYINIKIELDIEEIYMCFRLLRRLSAQSEFFLQVYDIILPHLQATVRENYGGIFSL